eukprot:GHVN01031874.1.p1 GENE.GHVN01031874.1~~GHVN01031874.1.p1  ORF type:complete len:182 (+),score=28.36 GHVN01031874.1:125-670(+)
MVKKKGRGGRRRKNDSDDESAGESPERGLTLTKRLSPGVERGQSFGSQSSFDETPISRVDRYRSRETASTPTPAGGRTPTTGKRHDRKEINLVIAEDDADDTRPLSWSQLRCGPSQYPRRPMCVVCGLPAPYKCALCAKLKSSGSTVILSRYFCSLGCKETHELNDCGKVATKVMGDLGER